MSRASRSSREPPLDGAETVRRILGFARAKGDEHAEPVEIASLLQQVVEIARPRWKDEAQARGALINVALDWSRYRRSGATPRSSARCS